MIFEPTPIAGIVLIRLEPLEDERGFFARAFCEDEFRTAGLPSRFPQSSISYNLRAGTLRGLHFQPAPHAEAKVVRCIAGEIFDVGVDLRSESPTRGQWFGRRLTAATGDAIYFAPGIAHGFQTMCDNATVLYQITPAYRPGHAAGVRWNDPAFAIPWPIATPVISSRDAGYEDWAP